MRKRNGVKLMLTGVGMNNKKSGVAVWCGGDDTWRRRFGWEVWRIGNEMCLLASKWSCVPELFRERPGLEMVIGTDESPLE